MSLAFYIKNPGRGIWFYIDYQRLNTIIKKDQYLITLIEKALVKLKSAKYFIKIDIWQAFYLIKMSKDSKMLTTLFTRVAAFKYLVILFTLYNKPAC